MLKLDGVQKQYKDFCLNCSLQVEEGRITGIIGANGAGKSTTFKAALGLIHIDGGRIEILGKDSRQISMTDKQQIGVVLAESTFSDILTIADVIAVMKAAYPNFRKERFIQKCEKYGLPMKKPLNDFSTGMKAKFKLLIAMSYDAKFLILDEPTVGLDAVARNDLLDEMREYMSEEDRGILVSSHISSDLEGLCDDLYFLQNGSILFHEDTDVILSDYGILKVDEEQYRALDKRYINYRKKESFGYKLLTRDKQFYLDNYPAIVVEKGSIDDIMLMVAKGEKE
ncbi:MAG: ABC transporter ATP-binding protein [Blautia sp.]|nr:ABC transporter ATP-binding protein [Lachnoclostridium sp.]MCM1211376.1 ABC transporter ATP-binding protein [Blautia sp.]